MREESLIAKLRALKDDPSGQRQVLRNTWTEDSPMMRKAAKNFKMVAERIAGDHPGELEFVAGYLDSCYRNAIQAAETAPSTLKVSLEGGSRVLYLCWHFRDYPCIRAAVLARNALILVAKDADFMKDLADAGLTFNFRTSKSMFNLLRAMRNGRPIVAMFDYCYEGTRQDVIEFLSYPVKTPTGILRLAHMFGYEARVIGPVGGGVGTVGVFREIKDERKSALAINSCIGNNILQNPVEWLMWPALDQRLAEDQG